MIVFLWAWLITLVVGWLVIDELYWWWRNADDEARRIRAAWRWTIDDLEAANRRIAALETQLATERSGDEWKQ